MENQPRGSKKRERRGEKRFLFQSPKPEENYMIVNLSARGALFTGLKQMEAGQKTSLQVTLPKGLTKLHLQGEIKWVKQVGQGEKKFYLAGIQFEGQDEKTFKIMDAYLQYLQRGKFIQSQQSIAILHLENLNRVITLEPLKKKGFPDHFNPFDDG